MKYHGEVEVPRRILLDICEDVSSEGRGLQEQAQNVEEPPVKKLKLPVKKLKLTKEPNVDYFIQNVVKVPNALTPPEKQWVVISVASPSKFKGTLKLRHNKAGHNCEYTAKFTLYHLNTTRTVLMF